MSDSIRCAVRARPCLDGDFVEEKWQCDGQTISKRAGNDSYSFERIFNHMDTNSSIFCEIVEPLIDGSLAGFNTCIMGYGQSGSGKTHTLTGSHDEEGITQLSFSHIFNQIAKSNRTYILQMSILEVYNEKISDLIGNGEDLTVRQSSNGSEVVEGVVQVHVTSLAEVESLLASVAERRSVGETALNERSSRSHVIYRINMESCCTGEGVSLSSSLSFVDLAGSENAAAASTQGQRLSEGRYINRSLLTLCKVIQQLSDKLSFVGYRESKLTRLLKSSFSGNSRILMVATVNLTMDYETSSTLKLASRAVKVEVTPVINERREEGVLSDYLRQIEQLKEQLKNKSAEDEKEFRMEEKTRKLEELTKMILIGGENATARTAKEKKNRRMTWAPGRKNSAFSPLMNPFKQVAFNEIAEENAEKGTNEGRVSLQRNSLSHFSFPNFSPKTVTREVQTEEWKDATVSGKEEEKRGEDAETQTDIDQSIGSSCHLPRTSADENETAKLQSELKDVKEQLKQVEEERYSLKCQFDKAKDEALGSIMVQVEAQMREYLDQIQQLRKDNERLERLNEKLINEEGLGVNSEHQKTRNDELERRIYEMGRAMVEKTELVKERDMEMKCLEQRKKQSEEESESAQLLVKEQKQQLEEFKRKIRNLEEDASRGREERNKMAELVKEKYNESTKMRVELENAKEMEKNERKRAMKEEQERKMAERERDEVKNREENLIKALHKTKTEMFAERRKRVEAESLVKELERPEVAETSVQTEVEYDEDKWKRELEEYKATMEQKEKEGIRKATENIKYWEERARAAEKKTDQLKQMMKTVKGEKKTTSA